MDQIFTMFDDLKTCYSLKVPDVNGYMSLKDNEKGALCRKLREQIVDYLDSDKVLFENHLNNVVKEIKGKIKKFKFNSNS